MSKQRLTSQNLTTIIIAIIGVIGSVAVAYFAFRGSTAPLELSISATQTADANRPLVADFATQTPASILVEILSSDTPTLEPMQDFSTNCINAIIWTPSPESTSYKRTDDCWDLSSRGIAAQNGKLFLAVQNDTPQSGSLYISAPKTGTIEFKVRIDTFVSGEPNGNLAFGIGTITDWLTDGEFLFFRTTKTGCYLVYGNSVTEVGNKTLESYKLGSEVDILFQFNNLVFDVYVNDSTIASNLPLSTPDSQVFWIGYRLPLNSKLIASVSDFRLER